MMQLLFLYSSWCSAHHSPAVSFSPRIRWVKKIWSTNPTLKILNPAPRMMIIPIIYRVSAPSKRWLFRIYSICKIVKPQKVWCLKPSRNLGSKLLASPQPQPHFLVALSGRIQGVFGTRSLLSLHTDAFNPQETFQAKPPKCRHREFFSDVLG